MYSLCLEGTMVAANGVWTTGLCGCFDDINSCCCACCCPCILVGRAAQVVSEGKTDATSGCLIHFILQVCAGAGCVYSFMLRTALKKLYSIPEDAFVDFVTECCCPCCAVAQNYRELVNRGWKPELAYNDQVAEMQKASVTAPGAQEMEQV